LPPDFKLQYNIGNGFSDWDTTANAEANNVFDTVDGKLLITFQLYNEANGGTTITGGTLTFLGDYTAIIEWEGFSITVAATNSGCGDTLGPVPIPSTAWILGTGIIGLVGIRRKLKS